MIDLVAKLGAKKWSQIAAQLPGRIGKQCRERWHNHLNPAIKKVRSYLCWLRAFCSSLGLRVFFPLLETLSVNSAIEAFGLHAELIVLRNSS